MVGCKLGFGVSIAWLVSFRHEHPHVRCVACGRLLIQAVLMRMRNLMMVDDLFAGGARVSLVVVVSRK